MATPSWLAAGDEAAGMVETTVARIAASRPASIVLIVVVALVCFLPGFFSIPPLDGDESAYVVGAREIVATSELAPLHVQTDMQPWRPHGTEWLEALTTVVTGQGAKASIWVYRIPSLIAALAASVLVWWAALAFGRPRAALLAGLLFAGSGILGLQARLAGPEALLTAATTLAAGALARLWLSREQEPPLHWAVVFWLAIGAGFLFAGPVAPAMAAVAVLILTFERGTVRWLGAFRPGIGVGIAILALTPWLVSVAALSVADVAGPDVPFLTRIGVPFSIEAPPGSYLLLAPLLVGPAMTFIFIAMPWLVNNLGRPEILFALAWGGPLWIAAEFYPEKLPQYVLPAVPMMAWIAATAIDAGVARIGGKVSLAYSTGPLIWPPFVLVALPLIFFLIEGSFPVAATLAFLAAAVAGPVSWLWLRQARAIAATAMALVTVAFIYLGFFGFFVPGLSAIRVGERIVEVATASVPCRWPRIAAAGFPEESLVFAGGRGTLLTDGFGAADFLDSPGCRVAAVDTTQISSFRQRLDDLGIEAVDRGHVTGVNLRKVRRVNIHIFSVAPEGG